MADSFSKILTNASYPGIVAVDNKIASILSRSPLSFCTFARRAATGMNGHALVKEELRGPSKHPEAYLNAVRGSGHGFGKMHSFETYPFGGLQFALIYCLFRTPGLN